MDTQLSRIAKAARNRPKERMTSLVHLLDKQRLWDCHLEMQGDKAAGVDGVTKAEYERELESNLEDLISRMKRQAYKPKPSRRTYIPKENGDKRPLGIPSYEDKLVQKAMSQILNAIYEEKFLPCSYGFRPGRSQHQALQALDRLIMKQGVRYIVDVDIKGFFNHVDHKWLKRFLEHDIADLNFLRLVARFLKGGVMEEGKYLETVEGTPQGGNLSPILANVYLHYVLDLWFEIEIKGRQCRGKAGMVRFADDFVCGFEREEEAKAFYEALEERMGKFNLTIAEEKTKLIRFGYGAEVDCKRAGLTKPGTFDFLGFRHIWGKGKSGKYRLIRKTSPKKFRLRVKEFTRWARQNRHLPEWMFVDTVRRKLRGHYQYYGVSDNWHGVSRYYSLVIKAIWKWRNRRSQKRTFTLEKFKAFLARNPLPEPCIMVNLYATVNGNLKSRMP
ncbi:group II intron reverse transcriptase/maturase [Paenibacillus albidus]|uniref:group II intron reverse transcriptase/maturase n=1 Tax=Paenibacillus albidus TaxID=2041023 RepID=UPI001BEC1633|nr:group II intron reverse transcriptase/maturase [Paenibacillus albidus]MBT2290985.1 group II intron reverse transcriptase/maturase [Paenibacillus albidus]